MTIVTGITDSTAPRKLVLASGNRGKLAEFQQLLQNVGFDVIPQTSQQVPEIEETGLSFVENAILKARNAAAFCGLPALADDSGIEVDALHGAPGIYSARFAGAGASDADNNRKLLDMLRDVPLAQRTARYRCVLVFMRHGRDPSPLICDGAWEGLIVDTPRGDNGFGYDPFFFVPDQNVTAAELPPALKNQLSHRGVAMAKLLQALRTAPTLGW
jgi:XTP/dITP diphosphohydrolase